MTRSAVSALASAPPLLYTHRQSCLRLNGAQEVEGRATDSLVVA